jgi:serine/threonine protein phosphatase PrpC
LNTIRYLKFSICEKDAHNAILDYDKENKTSFFAVYDGHGGMKKKHSLI